MSDPIKHECGIALVRLLKPLSYYQEKYGTWMYGLNKLYLLMEKQHNRGQDGAGVVNVKIDVEPGREYLDRYRSVDANPIKDVFDQIYSKFNDDEKTYGHLVKDAAWAKKISLLQERFLWVTFATELLAAIVWSLLTL